MFSDYTNHEKIVSIKGIGLGLEVRARTSASTSPSPRHYHSPSPAWWGVVLLMFCPNHLNNADDLLEPGGVMCLV